MINKFSGGVNLLLNPIVYFIVVTQVIAILNLAINFKSLLTKPSSMIVFRGMGMLLMTTFLAGVSLPAIYLIANGWLRFIVISLMVLFLVVMLTVTAIKVSKVKLEQLLSKNGVFYERKANDFIDEQLSVMHNLPPLLPVIIIVFSLVGYNTLRVFPTFSGICLLFSLGFISLICYQFAFASWLVSKKLKTLSEKKE